jgi:hypothetical protein
MSGSGDRECIVRSKKERARKRMKRQKKENKHQRYERTFVYPDCTRASKPKDKVAKADTGKKRKVKNMLMPACNRRRQQGEKGKCYDEKKA